MQEIDQLFSLLATGSKDLSQLIEEKQKELGISNRSISTVLQINKDTLQRILNLESKKVDIVSLINIANFLEVEIEEVFNIYTSSMKKEDMRKVEKSRSASFIVKNFDLPLLRKIGFIQSVTDYEAIEDRIVTFFRLDRIYQYNYDLATTLFSRSKTSLSDRTRTMWLKCAFTQFENLNNPNPYKRDTLLSLVTKIRHYTRLEKRGLITVVKALWAAGVTVIVQRYLSKTAVKGATMLVNSKPCIVLTNFQGRYDSIWETLLHELCHVIYDYQDLESTIYHLSGEPDLLLNEERADLFAREMLFPKEKLDFIKPHISNSIFVEAFAKKNDIHPSIIYGFYLKENENDYRFYRKKIPRSDIAIEKINVYPWDKEHFDSEIVNIKQQLNHE